MSPRFVIVHYHILKNAGTTVEELLYRNFREKFARFDTEDRDYARPNSELLEFLEANPQIEAVSSHQLYDPVPLVRGYIFLDLCFLRDPLERIRSTYDFFRAKPAPGDPISDLAGRATLRDFIARLIEDYPWMVNDVQTNQLANGLINDLPKGAEDLERATRRMRNTSLLGVVDRYEESIAAMQRSTRMIFPNFNRRHEPVNVSRGLEGTLAGRTAQLREACGEDVFCELMRLNQLDFELLSRAREEIDLRIERCDEPRCPASEDVNAIGDRKGTRWQVLKILPRLRNPAFFDAEYYRRNNPRAGNPRLHFFTRGAFEGRNPHPLIDLAYFARTGNPHPLFDAQFYLEKNPDVRAAGIDPFLHYVLHGENELRKPHPWFDAKYYVAQCPEALGRPLRHFLETSAGNPHPLFEGGAHSLRALMTAVPSATLGVSEGSESVALEIDDVPLHLRIGRDLWQDDDGRTHFHAPPHLRGFLEPLRFPQIHAQV